MTPPSFRRPISVIAGAFIAFVMFGVAVPSKAYAACGHYAQSNTERTEGARLLKLDILSGATASQSALPEWPAPCPCSGPSCSEGPSQPNAPLPPTSSLTGERWLAASFLVDLAALDSFRFRVHEPAPRPVNRPGTLERPPRFLPV